METIIRLLSGFTEWLFHYVIVRGVIAYFLAGRVRKLLVRTQRDMAIWLHYKNRALKHGHQHKTPVECQQGDCKLV